MDTRHTECITVVETECPLSSLGLHVYSTAVPAGVLFSVAVSTVLRGCAECPCDHPVLCSGHIQHNEIKSAASEDCTGTALDTAQCPVICAVSQ